MNEAELALLKIDLQVINFTANKSIKIIFHLSMPRWLCCLCRRSEWTSDSLQKSRKSSGPLCAKLRIAKYCAHPHQGTDNNTLQGAYTELVTNLQGSQTRSDHTHTLLFKCTIYQVHLCMIWPALGSNCNFWRVSYTPFKELTTIHTHQGTDGNKF